MKGDKLLIPLAALSLAGTAVAYFFLPEKIPLQWDFSGQVSTWGAKWNILWLGALPLASIFLFRWLPRIDPNREAYRKHEKTYAVIQRLIVVGMAALVWITILASLGTPLDIGSIVRILVGLLFVGLGNFMGRLKRNYFVGIKTPWALADDEVWRLTHRRGGIVFVAMGAAYLLSLAIPAGAPLEVVMIATTLGGVAYAYAYSYFAWRRLRGEEKPEARK